ncbi:hypothetical protein JVX91_00605 [Pseudomonas sp. PDNC002]|uniref:hypothetical protein n=1 Tax=Pseudomonas sp. PDNC002 TaxID=2811422 RepID=UPI0019641CA2|nr:hypothetical protein [Pseudomonas sp. PDNC002]QRY79648.1 hypothetical protein JVX91_00605 [Pseudomonas sp. PDNC002]
MIIISPGLLHDFDDELSSLEQDQIPFAAALALTRTAQAVEKVLVTSMRTVFDRPTPYTLNSLRVFPATKEKLVARVWMKDESVKAEPATRWLTPEIYGGDRRTKRVERQLRERGILPEGKYVVPGAGAKLDKYGNMNRGQVTKALSGIGGYTQQGYDANATDSARSVKKGNYRHYFVMHGPDRQPIGIAERTAKGKDGLAMILAFVSKPTYRKTFDFHQIAQREAEARLRAEAEKAVAEARRTRR